MRGVIRGHVLTPLTCKNIFLTREGWRDFFKLGILPLQPQRTVSGFIIFINYIPTLSFVRKALPDLVPRRIRKKLEDGLGSGVRS